ncbi:hypothetical protein DVH24_032506 [Malus domestica]|uniref:Uncharacterized protein n=1 Tax=Malus domestica TaxID=3750 RepID=A0A498J305_MALDO|nr:hypothetical protein DVH24_032506 [Malus domestica]
MLQSARRRLVDGEGMLSGGCCSRTLGFLLLYFMAWASVLFVGSIGLVWQVLFWASLPISKY